MTHTHNTQRSLVNRFSGWSTASKTMLEQQHHPNRGSNQPPTNPYFQRLRPGSRFPSCPWPRRGKCGTFLHLAQYSKLYYYLIFVAAHLVSVFMTFLHMDVRPSFKVCYFSSGRTDLVIQSIFLGTKKRGPSMQSNVACR